MKRKRYVLVAFLLVAVGVLGCGGSKTHDGRNADGTVTVRGKVSVRGSSPGSLILLEGDDGKLYQIQASAMGEELRNLSGMDVYVEAVRLPEYEQLEPVLAVRHYDLLRLPSGERPIIGIVQVNADNVWLLDENYVRWVVIGEFQDVFQTFPGAKVWVVGVTKQTLDTRQESIRTLHITEYGVIRP